MALLEAAENVANACKNVNFDPAGMSLNNTNDFFTQKVVELKQQEAH